MTTRRSKSPIPIAIAAFVMGAAMVSAYRYWQRAHAFAPVSRTVKAQTVDIAPPFQRALATDLHRQAGANIRYHDGYYVGGEPPVNEGVCTDVVIRAYRAAGVDIHRAMTDDVRAHSKEYDIANPDPNIDHRRCRNLIVFFRRHSRELATKGANADWQAGDVVFWDTHGNGRVDHVGMVSGEVDSDGNPAIIHHWPGLPVNETNGLFRYKVVGHFRWIR